MTVQELFKSINTEELVNYYLKNDFQTIEMLFDKNISDEDKKEKFNEYKQTLTNSVNYIKDLNIKNNPEQIIFVISYDDNGDHGWDCFSTYIKDLFDEGKEYIERYSVEFQSLEEVLGSEISFMSRYMYTDLAILNAVLFELTFFTSDLTRHQMEVNEELSIINERVEEAKNAENCLPIEHLFEEIGWKDERSQTEKNFDEDIIKIQSQHHINIYDLYFNYEKICRKT